MAIGDFDDLLRQIRDHPEWRDELRRVVLTDELLSLPATVARLADTSATHGRPTARPGRAMEVLTRRLDALVEQVSEMAGHVEWLKGDAIERRYRERAAAYFGRVTPPNGG